MFLELRQSWRVYIELLLCCFYIYVKLQCWVVKYWSWNSNTYWQIIIGNRCNGWVSWFRMFDESDIVNSEMRRDVETSDRQNPNTDGWCKKLLKCFFPQIFLTEWIQVFFFPTVINFAMFSCCWHFPHLPENNSWILMKTSDIFREPISMSVCVNLCSLI